MAELTNGGPYLWLAWLGKLLVGEDSCEWAAWFKSQHEGWSWQNRPQTGFDQVGWLLAHTRAVADCRERWESDGYTAFTEGQNSFALRGRSAALGASRTWWPGRVMLEPSSTSRPGSPARRTWPR